MDTISAALRDHGSTFGTLRLKHCLLEPSSRVHLVLRNSLAVLDDWYTHVGEAAVVE